MTLVTPNVRETPFRIYYKRLIDRGMRPISAVGHLSGKLASVFYQCLKTKEFYDEGTHRKQMGLIPTTDDHDIPIEIQDVTIDEMEFTDTTSELPIPMPHEK